MRKFKSLHQNKPYCIYCGGSTLATTVDHFPARILFDGKDRPKGWEFPACENCNSGTKHVDLVVALISRLYPDAKTKVQNSDLEAIFNGIANNIPGVLNEMAANKPSQNTALGAFSTHHELGAVRIGPILQEYINIFCLKFALASHFKLTGEILPNNGVIIAGFVTNLEATKGLDVLKLAKSFFPTLDTLKQGKKQVLDQFAYAHGNSAKKDLALCVAQFRRSFQVFGATFNNAKDMSKFEMKCPGQSCTPLDLSNRISQLKFNH